MSTQTHHRPEARRGVSTLLMAFATIVLFGFVALAVDLGRLRLARAQLQTGADAGARGGASQLPYSVANALDAAERAAELNQCLDSLISLDTDEDIVFGRWNKSSGTFTVIQDDGGKTDPRQGANAMRVYSRRWSQRNESVRSVFAHFLNSAGSNVEAAATAFVRGGPTRFGIVGIDYVRSNGNKAVIDSYLPSQGAYTSATARKNAMVASDGDITLGNGDIHGDARPGMDDGNIYQHANSHITGWTAPLDVYLRDIYLPATLAPNATYLKDLDKKNVSMTLQGSNDPAAPRVYYCNKLNTNRTLTINGYVKLYVLGPVDIRGASLVQPTTPALPAKFELVVVGTHDVDMGGTTDTYIHLYAPESNVRIHGTADLYGTLVGGSLDFIGTGDIHYDESESQSILPYRVMLVQ